MITDHSYGRQTDGDVTWVDFVFTTPGFSNNQTVGINDQDNLQPFEVFPNPVKSGDKIFFNKLASISLYDAMGQLISSSEDIVFFNISELNSGVYLIKTDKGELVKFVKL